MASKQIEEFPLVTSPDDLDIIHISRGGADRSITVSDLIPSVGTSGTVIVNTFTDGVEYTAGVSNAINISQSIVSKNTVWVFFDGIYQEKNTYTIVGNVVTFDAVIPVGVSTIEVLMPQILPLAVTTSADNVQFAPSGETVEDILSLTIVFNTVQEMKDATWLQVGWACRTLGHTVIGDGGGNDYQIVAAATGTDDGGSFIDLSGSGLQARGLFPGAIGNVKQFGVVGDGVTDDRPAIVACDTFGGIYLIDKETDLTLSSPYTATNAYFQIDPQAVLANATADGDFTASSGFLGDSANKYRIPTRLFVGQAADKFNGNSLPDTGTSWLSTTADGPAYIPANALFLAMTNPGDPSYAVCGAAKVDPGGTRAAHAFAGVAINQGTASARGGIFEIQHETTTNTSWGLEVQVKNASGGGQIISPYGAVSNMTFGLQITAGGDDAFGPVSTDPATAAMIISASQSAGAPGWFTGIQFREDCVVGAEPEAIAFADGLAIKWYEPDTRTPAAVIKSDITVAGKTIKQIFSDDQLHFQNEAAADIFTLAATPTAINRVQINATDTGIPPRVSALGTDTNIDLRFLPKGTGLVRFGAHAAIGSETITGYIQIKDDTGVTRKLAVVS